MTSTKELTFIEYNTIFNAQEFMSSFSVHVSLLDMNCDISDIQYDILKIWYSTNQALIAAVLQRPIDTLDGLELEYGDLEPYRTNLQIYITLLMNETYNTLLQLKIKENMENIYKMT